jgi:hypothetical protein
MLITTVPSGAIVLKMNIYHMLAGNSLIILILA